MTQIEWGVSLIFIIGISCQRAVEAYKDREGGGVIKPFAEACDPYHAVPYVTFSRRD